MIRAEKNGLFFLFVILGVFLFAPTGMAKEFPDHPITLVSPTGPGMQDTMARIVSKAAEKELGVPIVVESKPGGGATVAAGLVASKKPDGYTLGVVSTAALTMRPHVLKLSYNPLKDFTVIMQYSRYIGGLCVLNDSPLKTIDEFIAYAKANPGLSYGSSGMFTQQQLAGVFVPYRPHGRNVALRNKFVLVLSVIAPRPAGPLPQQS